MVNFCCVRGCGHRSNRDRDVSFFRIPTVCKRKSNFERNLIQQRRTEWLSQICRKHFTETTIKPWHRVCSRHFVSGKPARFEDSTHPDWIPTVHLGHTRGKKVKVDKYERLQNRNTKKKLVAEEQLADHAPPDSAAGDHFSNLDSTHDMETQTEMTGEYINQLESVIKQFTVENTDLRENLSENQMHDENFYQKKADRVKFYTGLPNYVVLMALVSLISKNLKETPQNALSKFRQVVLTLMRLRLNLPEIVIADMFGISQATVSRTFHYVLDVLYVQLQPLVFWPDRESLHRNMPACFMEHFGRKVTVIIDCFEVRLERSSSLQAKNQTYSNYKHGNTFKILIGITPQGVVSYISKCFGGRSSDKFVTEHCTFLNNLQVGDLVLADRGFNIHDSVGLMCAEVKTPAFTKGKKQLSAFEVEATRKLANVRIHVERVIGSLRQKYTILDSTLQTSYADTDDNNMMVLDRVVFVCCALVNCCASVVLSDDGSLLDLSLSAVPVLHLAPQSDSV